VSTDPVPVGTRVGSLVIGPRYNGPPTSGNGGYTSGCVASYVDASPVEVTLRRPPPLETVLPVIQSTVGIRVLGPDGEVVADALPAALPDDALVPPVPYADAVAASAGYRGLGEHPFPTCFVCGPLRPDGLRLFPGPLDDGRTATPWLVPDDISPEILWASLDCPGGWSVPLEARPYVLGRFTVRIDALPEPGEECVVMGLMVGEEGRKAYAHTTLSSPAGAVLARARATWVALTPTTPSPSPNPSRDLG